MGDDLKLIDALTMRMRDLQARQGVIAQNIANADTPGYRTRELKSPDFQALLGDGDRRVAKPTVRFSPTLQALGGRSTTATMTVSSTEEKPNGNNVSLEDQVIAMGQVQSDYQAATSLYRKSIGLLKIALGR